MRQILVLVLSILVAATTSAADPNLALGPGKQPGCFDFDTGTLRGTLRLDGTSQGIAQLVHAPSSVEVTYGEGHVGIFSPYRIFSTGKRYTHAARDWPSQPTLRSDGAVEVFFPPAEDHPMDMTAVYRIAAADTIDLELALKPQKAMPQFEVFLSSYFGKDFAAWMYLPPHRFIKDAKPGFVRADVALLFDSNYVIFPRDREVMPLIFDGRWQIPPSGVEWCVPRWMAAPLALRRSEATGITAALMCPPEDCFAVSMSYNKTPPDNIAAHQSVYQSLFGRDVAADETIRARCRLIVGKDLADEEIVKRYQAYLEETKRSAGLRGG